MFALLLAIVAPQNASAITNPDKVSVFPSSVPWMVTLWQIDSRFDRVQNGYACGGALIDPFTVVTAAHCIDSLSDTGFSIVLGQRYSSSRGFVAQPRTVTYYPKYKLGSYLFDIAIIDLYAPFESSSYLRVAANPEVAVLLRKPTVLYGWGENERGKLPTMLRRVVQQDMSKLAKKIFPDFLLRTQFAVGRLNANKTFSGACNLDSGSPLIGTVKGKPVLLGVASHGSLKSCTTKTPRVFTRTSWFGPWIARIQADNARARQQAGIDYGSAFYFGSGLKQLPATSGVWADERTYISQRAVFGTETSVAGTLDISTLDATALAPSVEGGDFVIDISSRTPWSGDTCEWRDLALSQSAPIVRLSVRESEGVQLRTAFQFSYEPNQQDCFGELGQPMTVAAFNNNPLPTNCVPRILMTVTGKLRIVAQERCFTDLTKTMLRVELASQSTYELEPGIDEWAGPFDLRHPERAR